MKPKKKKKPPSILIVGSMQHLEGELHLKEWRRSVEGLHACGAQLPPIICPTGNFILPKPPELEVCTPACWKSSQALLVLVLNRLDLLLHLLLLLDGDIFMMIDPARRCDSSPCIPGALQDPLPGSWLTEYIWHLRTLTIILQACQPRESWAAPKSIHFRGRHHGPSKVSSCGSLIFWTLRSGRPSATVGCWPAVVEICHLDCGPNLLPPSSDTQP